MAGTCDNVMFGTYYTSAYFQSLALDAKHRYKCKLSYNSETKFLPDPYSLKDKWSGDPNTWPDLTFGDIYLYLIDTPSLYTKESMKAYKSLEAYKYVVSGHVQAVMSHPVSDSCPYVALKSKVVPSQKARDKPHEPWVYLEKKNGTVYCAHCTCMAGLGEVCSHIAALLFKVEMAVKMGLTQNSSTSQACQWNSTFRKEVTPATVTEIYGQIRGKRTKEISSFQATGTTPLPPSEVLEELYSIIPNASFFTSISIPNQLYTSTPVKIVKIVEKYPKLLASITNDVRDLSDSTDLKYDEIYDNYSVSDYQAHNLESATRNQSISPLWYQHRMGRVTASRAHDILTRKDRTLPDNLVKQIVGYNTYDLSKKAAVKWGIDNEEECRNLFTKHQTSNHVDFVCRLSGFIINTAHPFLGASPDGFTSCQCCGKGVLEIKCSYKHRDIPVQEAAANDRQFCLDRNLQLKSTHRYYSQIQFQMFISKLTFCDFVVYNKCRPAPSMVIVRVPIDVEFCKTLISKCELFTKTFIIKELVTRELENQKEEISALNNQDKDNDLVTWCICSEPEYGRMIKCDNSDCPYEWFHYKCVNVRRKPRGQWFCPNCET